MFQRLDFAHFFSAQRNRDVCGSLLPEDPAAVFRIERSVEREEAALLANSMGNRIGHPLMAEYHVIPGAMFLDSIDLSKLTHFEKRHVDHRGRVSKPSLFNHHLAIGSKQAVCRSADAKQAKHFSGGRLIAGVADRKDIFQSVHARVRSRNDIDPAEEICVCGQERLRDAAGVLRFRAGFLHQPFIDHTVLQDSTFIHLHGSVRHAHRHGVGHCFRVGKIHCGNLVFCIWVMREEQPCELILQDTLKAELSGKREETVVAWRPHVEHHDSFRRNVDAEASCAAERVGSGHCKIVLRISVHGISCKAVREDRIDTGSDLIDEVRDFFCGVEEAGELIPGVLPWALLPECFTVLRTPAVIARILRMIAVISFCGCVNPREASPEVIEFRFVERKDMDASRKHHCLQPGELQLSDIGIKSGAGETMLLFVIEILIVFFTRRHQGKILEPSGVFNQPDETFPGDVRHEIGIADG